MKLIRKYRENTIYELFQKPIIHFHWINENILGTYWDEDKQRRLQKKGPAWKQGRAWFSIGDYDKPKSQPATLRFEWHFLKKNLSNHITLNVGGYEDDFSFGVSIKGLFSLWFGTEDLIPRNFKKKHKWWPYSGYGRHSGISLTDEYIWIDIWRDDSRWSNKDPWWQHITIRWKDIFFGRVKYTREDLRTEETTVTMPEGEYPATIKFFRSTWKRPRLPAQVLDRADIEVKQGIPTPGKGENGWDCGEDKTFGLTAPATTRDEIVNKLVESVMRDRERY